MFLLALIPCQIWLYFVQSFPSMFVGFNVSVECESLVKNCEDNEIRDFLSTSLWVDNPRKVKWEAHAKIWIVFCKTVFHESLSYLGNLRVTRKILCLYVFNCAFLIYLATLYKPTLPTKL